MKISGTIAMPARLIFSLVVVCWAASLEAQSLSQQRRMQMTQQAQLQPFELEGAVQGVMRGRIAVIDGNEQLWQVAIPMNAKVQVIGDATADVLQNGSFIEFEADFDERGTLKEPVGELTIVTPTQEKQVGIFPIEETKTEDAADAGAAAEEDQKPAKPAKPAKRGKAAKASIAGKYHVIGKLIVGRGNKLSVNAGDGAIPLELTEQPAVSINVSDYSIAMRGDLAKVKGMTMAGRPGMIQATDVTIELAEPVTGEKKKAGPAKSGSKHSAKRGKKDEGLPEPAADR